MKTTTLALLTPFEKGVKMSLGYRKYTRKLLEQRRTTSGTTLSLVQLGVTTHLTYLNIVGVYLRLKKPR